MSWDETSPTIESEIILSKENKDSEFREEVPRMDQATQGHYMTKVNGEHIRLNQKPGGLEIQA